MFSFFKKSQEQVQPQSPQPIAGKSADGLEHFEEVQEKKTSTLGSFLLICMAILIIIGAETVFSDIKNIPTRPTPPSYCANISPDNLTGVYDSSSCTFGEIDKQFGVDVLYDAFRVDIGTIVSYNQKINALDNQINSLNYQLSNTKTDYNLSLQEKMAREKGIYDISQIQDDTLSLRSQIAPLDAERTQIVGERDGFIATIKSKAVSLKVAYDRAEDGYQTNYVWYRFKVFLLMLAFILPFFAIGVRQYFRLKQKNSQYTIIWTAIVGANAFLLIQVFLQFLWEIIPKTFLERLFKFFAQFPLTRYVLYYGAILLIIALFGGIVYYIQKKVFDPKKVAIRRFKERKCPNCSLSVTETMSFCPICRYTLKEPCKKCGKERYSKLPFCPACGESA